DATNGYCSAARIATQRNATSIFQGATARSGAVPSARTHAVRRVVWDSTSTITKGALQSPEPTPRHLAGQGHQPIHFHKKETAVAQHKGTQAMRAILIDPEKQTFTEIQLNGDDYREINTILRCRISANDIAFGPFRSSG